MAVKFSGLGAENKRNVYIAAGLGVVVLGLAASNFLGGGPTPAPAPVAQAPAVSSARPAVRSASVAHDATKLASPVNLDPTLHPELMAQAESLEYTGKGRNIFSLTSAPVEIPEPEKPARNTEEPAPVAAGPPAPAPPPSIDLKFFGFSTRPNGPRRAFLLKGDDVFVASEGDVVDHRYKVVKIAATSIQVEDIPYANTQSLPLIQTPASASIPN
jgi:hypothetical protein